MISVTNPANTHVLYVNAKSADPSEAKMIADAYAQIAREFIATKMDMREPNIFEEARIPTSPVSPQKTRDIVIGFLLGALLAAAVVTIKFLSDDRILSGEDISKVGGLSTLGMIPLQELEGDDNTDGKKKGHKKADRKERKEE
jgi:capsular polysaccharide biosynthesis protein